MTRLAEPHAGVLVDRFVDVDQAAELRDRAARLPQLTLTAREAADLDLVASGAASPLPGFMGLRDYRSVLERLRLADGTPWPVPSRSPSRRWPRPSITEPRPSGTTGADFEASST